MKKLDKNILKSIVKECLVEILAEGLISSGKNQPVKKAKLNEAIDRHRKKLDIENHHDAQTDTGIRRPSYLDNIKFNTNQDIKDDKIKAVAAQFNESASVMQDIFSDTAKTTLREQIGADSKKHAMISKPADNAARIVSESNPEDLFGSSVSKWASLAFM